MQNMQHEEAFDNLKKSKLISKIKLSTCRTYHTINGAPLYSNRFSDVEKFHYPGLAPVSDDTGSYHINLDGMPAYIQRYDKTFGFYFDRSSVMDKGQYYHINIEGHRIYSECYDWLGNYQENKCAVRKGDKFFHIDIDGNKIYLEKYDYVGDFKDDIAVVYKDGKAFHVNFNGKLIYRHHYNNLGVYHKGFATAEDDKGWFHIDINGHPIYTSRYKAVEPFYNGLARVEEFSGLVGQIDVKGNMVQVICKPSSLAQMHQISSELVGFWNTYLLNAVAQLGILQLLPMTTSLLAKKLKVNQNYLDRFLRALWEINLIKYNIEEEKWILQSKGQFFIDNPYMFKIAKMWGRVIAEKGWLEIPILIKQKEIHSEPSFKEKEEDDDLRTDLYQALLAYSTLDMSNFIEKININKDSQIILFGVHSLSLVKQLKEKSINSISYYNEFNLPAGLTNNFNINFIKKIDASAYYDCSILGRFFQHQDDHSVLEYFNILKRSKISRIVLIETLIEKHNPNSSAVDINIMVETGGKLRSVEEWRRLVKKIGDFKIDSVVPLTDYLSVIDIRQEIL